MRCEWFAKCDNEATRVVPSTLPLLPDVPVCQRCSDRVARLSGRDDSRPLDDRG